MSLGKGLETNYVPAQARACLHAMLVHVIAVGAHSAHTQLGPASFRIALQYSDLWHPASAPIFRFQGIPDATVAQARGLVILLHSPDHAQLMNMADSRCK